MAWRPGVTRSSRASCRSPVPGLGGQGAGPLVSPEARASGQGSAFSPTHTYPPHGVPAASGLSCASGTKDSVHCFS